MHSRVWSSLAALVVIFSLIAQPILPVQASSLGQVEGPRTGYNSETGMLSFLGADPARPIVVRAAQVPGLSPSDRGLAMIEPYAEQFGLSSPKQELTLMTSDQDGGRQITRYQQVYQGVPVIAGELIVNADERGLLSINGEISPGLEIDITPTVQADDARWSALEAMAKWYELSANDLDTSWPELWIYDPRLAGDGSRLQILVWRMEIFIPDDHLPLRELVLVDAHRGSVVWHFNQIDTAWSAADASQKMIFTELFPAAPDNLHGKADSRMADFIVPREWMENPGHSQSGQTTWRHAAQTPATWYVSAATGDDTNDCLAPTTPCAQIDSAVNKASSGDTIRITSDTYVKAPFTAYVVNIELKDINLSGGWNGDFTGQTGFTLLDGGGISNKMLSYTTVDRFIISKASTGVYNSSKISISNSSIHSNTTYGIMNFGAELTLKNVTVSGNNPGRKTSGGGILTRDSAITLTNVTITNNHAYYAGGIYNEDASETGVQAIRMSNTIIAHNSSYYDGPDCNGPIISEGHNIIRNPSDCTISSAAGDQLWVDPSLGEFLPTLGYQPLLPSSPAIDAGNNCFDVVDQRGIARVNTCDIGAYEYTLPGQATRVEVVSGNNQTTIPGANFPKPLKVVVLDELGSPVPSAQVSFEAPDAGPSALFANGTGTEIAISNDGGIATSSVPVANEQLGVFAINAIEVISTAQAEFHLENILWFVSVTGADSNTCKSPDQPCGTINGALAKISPGDVVHVSEGVYTGTGSEPVVSIDENVTLIGGWNQDFSSISGYSIVDGQYTRQAMKVGPGSTDSEVSRFTFQHGKTRMGAGIQNYGNLLLIEVIVHDNIAEGGGGISNHDTYGKGNLTIDRSAIFNNTAADSSGTSAGGGILNYGGNHLYVNDTTISGNRAEDGAGIYNRHIDVVILKNVTITGNRAETYGGGVMSTSFGTVITAENSIIAGNTAVDLGEDCMGRLDGFNNIIGVLTNCTTTSALPYGDPKLSSFVQGYFPLLPSSPAINRGSNCNSPIDQRGTPRVDACDIGAYEYRIAGPATRLVAVTTNIRVPPNLPATSPLSVAALDDYGTPVGGVPVILSAPETGPSGHFANGSGMISLTTDSTGLATSTAFTGNSELGSYQITAYSPSLSIQTVLELTNYALFVSVAGNNNNNCLTPVTACGTIYGALQKSTGGENILIESGRFTKDPSDPGFPVVNLTKPVVLRGGWNPDFTVKEGGTILDGEKNFTGIRNSGSEVLLFDLIITNSFSGLENKGDLVLQDVAVVRNHRTAIDNLYGHLTLINTTISGNQGTAIVNSGAVLTINNSTIVQNVEFDPTEHGGGIRNTNGQVTLENTIVAENYADQGPDCHHEGTGGITSFGHNIIGSTDGCVLTTATGDKINIDPLISQMLPTGYHPLMWNSPAINAGKPSTCSDFDQRGVSRLQNDMCDIGAYEYQTGGAVTELIGIDTVTRRSPVDTLFSNPFQVAAIDGFGSPVGGVTITFSAPLAAPSGSFGGSQLTTAVTDQSGIATSTPFTAGTQFGSYLVVATAGILDPVFFDVHNGAWLVSENGGNNSNDCLTPSSSCATIGGVLEKPDFNPGETLWLTSGTIGLDINSYFKYEAVIVGGWDPDFVARSGSSTLDGWLNVSNSGNIIFRRMNFKNGIDNAGTLVIEDSTFRHVNISNVGSPIENHSTGFMILRNVTITHLNVGAHPAVDNRGGNLSILNSTIADNLADLGVRNESGTVTIGDSIIANNRNSMAPNAPVFDCDGTIVSLGRNIIGNTGVYIPAAQTYSCSSDWTGTDLTGTRDEPFPAAQIMELAAQLHAASGQWVHPLVPGSPAIDTGSPVEPGMPNSQACPPMDQRGISRPKGTRCDIGAYEYEPYQSVPSQISTYDGGHSLVLPGDLLCQNSSATCASGIQGASSAHAFAYGTYDFYLARHGRQSIDGNGLEIVSTVRFGTNYDNAFWNGQQMVYGDRYGFANADDVVAHELTHGVTEYESGLFYFHQSGAISESLSDLWGEAYDQIGNPTAGDTPAVKWHIGEDVTGLGALRNMTNPPQFGDPDKMTSALYIEISIDNGGVHTNSGVNNKAVALMVDGGAFNGKTVSALGWPKVLTIYYEAQTNLLTSGADYLDLYNALYQACVNKIGTDEIVLTDCQEVVDATQAVEMHLQPAAGFNPEANPCQAGANPSNLFEDDFENGLGKWTLGAITGQTAWQLSAGNSISGRHMLWADDTYALSDSYAALVGGIALPASSSGSHPAYLHFNHDYAFEYELVQSQTRFYDGGILEYSINGGATWIDAAPLFMAGRNYTGQIYNPGPITGANPMRGRNAFIGDGHGYVDSLYNLTPLAGQTVRFRWHMGTDSSFGSLGWFVDDVHIYTCEVASTGNTDVYIGPPRKGSFDVLSNQLTIRNYASLLDGPVRVVNNNSDTTFTSQRVTSGASYNELMGVPPSQFTTEYWFPFYDHGYSSVPGNAMRTWVLVGNPDQDLTAQVDIYIGGTLRGSYFIPPGDNITPRWQGTVDGPVRVVSTNGVDIFASERVFTVPNNSFNETFGYPADQFTTEYWFPWYDSVSMNASILVGNTSSVDPAEVDIYIGPNFMGSYTIAANDTLIQSYPSTVNGPVRVVSTNGIDIVASEAALSGPVGNFTAYNEVMGYPFDQFATEYWFPYYDHGYPSVGGSNMRTWVLVGNPDDTLTADVDIYIAGVLQGTYSIPPGSRVTPRWTGLQRGPVQVVSDIPVFTSERVFTSPSNVFNEMMGYPASQLTFEYWFPWYDSINMTANIIIARP